MNLWLVAAADDASFANIPKSLAKTVTPQALKDGGVQGFENVYAWGARKGDSNDRYMEKMRPDDLCMFYTMAPNNEPKGYHWYGRVADVRRSTALSKSIWGTPDFEHVYLLRDVHRVKTPGTELNQLMGYAAEYYPRGFMRPSLSHEQVLAILNRLENETEKTTHSNEPMQTTPSSPLAPVASWLRGSGFCFQDLALKNFYSSLRAKPFVILAGNSGTGKSKLVRLFAEAVGATTENNRFHMIPVRPDWNDSAELLGYFDLNGAFQPGVLIAPLLIACDQPELPVFVCLDEMNLARVEYYFSDILSIIESRRFVGESITTDPVLPHGKLEKIASASLPDAAKNALRRLVESGKALRLPPNLMIVGTVNMDETTQPFSRKVLDRANTLEFNHINFGLDGFENTSETTTPKAWDAQQFTSRYCSLRDLLLDQKEAVQKISKLLETENADLKIAGFEVGYRVRDEASAFFVHALESGMDELAAREAILLQKVLPRIQGSSPRIEALLFSMLKRHAVDASVPDPHDSEVKEQLSALRTTSSSDLVKKLCGMLIVFIEEGFTSFWIV